MGTGSFLGVKSGRGVTLTPHLLLVLWSRKSRVISLRPLWAVRPVQSLSASTRVNFTYFKIQITLCPNTSIFRLPSASVRENHAFWPPTLTGSLFPIILSGKNDIALRHQSKITHQISKNMTKTQNTVKCL